MKYIRKVPMFYFFPGVNSVLFCKMDFCYIDEMIITIVQLVKLNVLQFIDSSITNSLHLQIYLYIYD